MINWDNEEETLKSYLIKGYTLRKIADLYNLSPSSVREQIVKRGLFSLFQHPSPPKKVLTEDEVIENKLKWYPSSEYKHTRNYLINNLKIDINFRTHKGILLKEDIIEQYYKSRENSKYIFSYDFSKLPEYVKDRKEKFTVFVNEISPKTGKLVGEWETCFKHLVIQRMDNGVCGGIKAKDYFALTKEEFIKRCIDKFGNTYDYSKVEYINLFTPILIKCNKCGKYFWQVPETHLESPGLGCPECAMADVGFRKYLGLEELSNRCDDIYGFLYDFSASVYSGMKNNITAINRKTGEEVTATVDEFLRGTVGRDKMSIGEKHVSDWLDENNINYSFNCPIFDKIQGRKSKYVKIDFIFLYNGREYWIEYNGEQHYKQIEYWVTKEEFLAGVNRDNNVRNFCKENNITLIEIPYTYDTFSKIEFILDKVILNNFSTDFIKIPEIKY